jgi:uncharacterized membrane protein (UPF0127 family)
MLRVMNTTRSCVVGDHVELADTSRTRLFGLLGRRGLDAGGGLWIKPSSGVHTFFMSFSIDVVGLDGNLKVIKLWRNLVPYRVTSVSLKMRSVLELPSGVILQTGMEVGDQLHISSASEAGAEV